MVVVFFLSFFVLVSCFSRGTCPGRSSASPQGERLGRGGGQDLRPLLCGAFHRAQARSFLAKQPLRYPSPPFLVASWGIRTVLRSEWRCQDPKPDIVVTSPSRPETCSKAYLQTMPSSTETNGRRLRLRQFSARKRLPVGV